MAKWQVGADRELPISANGGWDGAAATASVFTWGGWPDNPDPAKARRAFLLYDGDAPDLKGSYKLPFARVSDGHLVAVAAGLRAAASRLSQTDAPEEALKRAQAVLDAYSKRMNKDAGDYETKEHTFQITDLKAAGDGAHTLEGYASVFGGTPDSYGDIVAKGAFVESLRQRTPKFLWQHQMAVPIAKVISVSEDDKGLYGKWQLANTTAARDAYEYMRDGLVDALSIGFVTKEADYNEEGVRVLRRVDLYEISAVTIGASDQALISSVKTHVPFTQLLEQAGEVARAVTREAKALHDRRANHIPPRPLNDQHTQAIGDFLAEAKALHEELSALVVVESEAKAPDFGEIGLQLVERGLRLGRHRFKESA